MMVEGSSYSAATQRASQSARIAWGYVAASLFLGLAMAAPVPQARAADPKRPNIVFFFSDDHAYQAISAYNDPRKLLETPNLDRLGREGIRFDRAVVPNSICGPSRATVLTGKYSHLNGFYNNTNSRFDGSQTTFPKLLQAAGYQTAIVGKWHLVSDPTGFDYWHILPGQGVYYNPTMFDNGRRVQYEGYTTDIITDISLDWLKQRDKSKPFVLMCQHKAPHREWAPPLRHLGHDNDRKYPEPATLFDDYSGRGKAEQDQDMMIATTMTPQDLKLKAPPQLTSEQLKQWNAYYEPRNDAFQRANPTGADLVRWKYNRYMHDYLGCVKAVDESVGRVLKALEEEGLADNTLVIYTADQGFYLGEHGWFDKRWIFEESLRTPLLARWPAVIKTGQTSDALVSNVDFAETFLDVAGLPVPEEMQGRSLLPIFKGETPADWRKSFYYEYYEYPAPHHVRPHYGVVTDGFKLVRFYTPDVDYWELFDRKRDPNELKDVASDPAYAPVLEALKREVSRLRAELKVPAEPPQSAYGNPPAPFGPPAKKQQGKKAQVR
jgi:arylsulfatase A-like enzyme